MSEFMVHPGDRIQYGRHSAVVPSDVSSFLLGRGWMPASQDVWVHTVKGRYDLTWEQAMACEFYEFITLGGR